MNTHKRVVGILRELIEEDEETYSERAPLWKEKKVVWELKKRLLSVLAEPYKKKT